MPLPVMRRLLGTQIESNPSDYMLSTLVHLLITVARKIAEQSQLVDCLFFSSLSSYMSSPLYSYSLTSKGGTI